jgi:HK97 gp10 family phage protein
MTMTGDRELRELLSELPKRVASKGNRAAVTAGAKPIAKAARAKAPKQSGLLKKAMGTKIKTYRSGAGTIAVAVIGARRAVQGDYKGRKRVPANYIALVNNGTKHAQGNDFLGEAYRENKSAAQTAIAAKFNQVIEAEAAKLGMKK